MASGSNSTFSVIGSDITIKGDISASADLHVDGTIDGDIKCKSLVQGEGSKISGSVVAETARFSGHVNGSIEARELVILKSAVIEGDVDRRKPLLLQIVVHQVQRVTRRERVDGRFAPNNTRQTKPAAAPAPKPEVKSDDGQASLKIAG